MLVALRATTSTSMIIFVGDLALRNYIPNTSHPQIYTYIPPSAISFQPAVRKFVAKHPECVALAICTLPHRLHDAWFALTRFARARMMCCIFIIAFRCDGSAQTCCWALCGCTQLPQSNRLVSAITCGINVCNQTSIICGAVKLTCWYFNYMQW